MNYLLAISVVSTAVINESLAARPVDFAGGCPGWGSYKISALVSDDYVWKAFGDTPERIAAWACWDRLSPNNYQSVDSLRGIVYQVNTWSARDRACLAYFAMRKI